MTLPVAFNLNKHELPAIYQGNKYRVIKKHTKVNAIKHVNV